MSAWTECKVAMIKHMIETRIGRRASRGEDGDCLLDTDSVTMSWIMTPASCTQAKWMRQPKLKIYLNSYDTGNYIIESSKLSVICHFFIFF